jgi:electron transfer flavoprotein alpha subunit
MSFEPIEEDRSHQAKIVQVESTLKEENILSKTLEFIQPLAEDVDITKEEILVSVGRGLSRKENLPIAEELVKAIGGVLTGSRPTIDMGWLTKGRQVGLSGKTVKPKLYIALGISGQIQHQMGMKESEVIVVINNDPKAPIFNIADYGIVNDLFEIVPLLTEKLKSK